MKSILVPFSGEESEGQAIKVAFDLANIFHSNVKILHIAPDPKAFMAACYSGIGIPAPSYVGLIEDIEKRNENNRKKAEEIFKNILGNSEINTASYNPSSEKSSAKFHYEIGDAESTVVRQGKLSDITIMSRTIQQSNTDYANAAIGALFNSGRPVLFTPDREIENDIDLKVVIAWNGSAECSRAISQSMPLLRRAKVYVLSVDSEMWDDAPTNKDVCDYLEHHEVNAEPVSVKSKGENPGELISTKAKSLDAGMIIMGAFSHSRWKQMILGGVTTYMLENSDIPVLMAH